MRLQAAFFALALVSAPAVQAAEAAPHVEKAFLIPANEGYGTGECLTGGNSECGQVVANAWCEAQGFSRAETFGRAVDEVTGSTDIAMSKRSAAPIAITCAN